MRARAVAAEETGARILDAAVSVFWERPVHDVPLDEVARRAGVTVQTVLRRFGSKDALFAAAVERESARIERDRDRAQPGSVAEAVRILVDHYDDVGDGVLRMLAAEETTHGLRALVESGRTAHRRWCSRVFAPTLEARTGVRRQRRLAQLVAATDVLTWKLLRRDGGLSRAQTELAMRELLEPLTGAA